MSRSPSQTAGRLPKPSWTRPARSASSREDGTLTDEITRRLNWIYEIAFHAGTSHGTRSGPPPPGSGHSDGTNRRPDPHGMGRRAQRPVRARRRGPPSGGRQSRATGLPWHRQLPAARDVGAARNRQGHRNFPTRSPSARPRHDPIGRGARVEPPDLSMVTPPGATWASPRNSACSNRR
jgi:hypothetical protein